MGVSNVIHSLLSTAKPLAPHQEAYIKARGVLTGSVAFGVAEQFSDTDYILSHKQFMSLGLDMDRLRYSLDDLYNHDEYRSWYVKCEDGTVLNLLVTSSMRFRDEFIYATDKIMEFIKYSEIFAEKIKNKDFRCGAFEALRMVYTGGDE